MTTEKILFLSGFLILACVFDVRSRRIPNGLSAGVLACGIVLAFVAAGFQGLGSALAGALVALVVMMPLYVLGMMGAGDAKLMIALGTWLNAAIMVETLLYTFMAGALLALVAMLLRGGWGVGLSNVRGLFSRMLMRIRGAPVQIVVPDQQTYRFPYALAIAAGVWLAHLNGPLFSI